MADEHRLVEQGLRPVEDAEPHRERLHEHAVGAYAWPVKSTSAWFRYGARSVVSRTLRAGLLPWWTSARTIGCGATRGIGPSGANANVALAITVTRRTPRKRHASAATETSPAGTAASSRSELVLIGEHSYHAPGRARTGLSRSGELWASNGWRGHVPGTCPARRGSTPSSTPWPHFNAAKLARGVGSLANTRIPAPAIRFTPARSLRAMAFRSLKVLGAVALACSCATSA